MKDKEMIGCVDIWIDELDPCLRDTETNEMVETVVFKVESRKYLRQFRKNNGWHINWGEIREQLGNELPSI